VEGVSLACPTGEIRMAGREAEVTEWPPGVGGSSSQKRRWGLRTGPGFRGARGGGGGITGVVFLSGRVRNCDGRGDNRDFFLNLF